MERKLAEAGEEEKRWRLTILTRLGIAGKRFDLNTPHSQVGRFRLALGKFPGIVQEIWCSTPPPENCHPIPSAKFKLRPRTRSSTGSFLYLSDSGTVSQLTKSARFIILAFLVSLPSHEYLKGSLPTYTACRLMLPDCDAIEFSRRRGVCPHNYGDPSWLLLDDIVFDWCTISTVMIVRGSIFVV